MASRLPEPSRDPEGPLPAQQWTAAAVRRRRLELGWTQEQLAERSGLSAATVRKIEAGAQPTYRALTCTRLCTALGWAPDALDSVSTPPRSEAPNRRAPALDGVNGPHGASGSLPPASSTSPGDVELAALTNRIARLNARQWERLVAFVDGLTSTDR